MKATRGLMAVGLAAVLAGSGAAVGKPYNVHYDRAIVLDSEPIYETVEVNRPEERCWNERVAYRGDGYRSYTPPVVGGIIGGIIGNQFGHGGRRKAYTVAGTLLGASVGRDIQHRAHKPRRAVVERHCELVDRYTTEETVVGYRVKYRYRGQTYYMRTDSPPGDTVRVRVSVEPMEQY